MDLTPEDAAEIVSEYDPDGYRSEWLVCPNCGSEEAAAVAMSWSVHAVCPECGHNTTLAGE